MLMKIEAQWIVGFVDGEGCFHVALNAHKGMKSGTQCLPEFTVTQHRQDISILYALKSVFSCGVVRRNHGDSFCYRVRSHGDLLDKIIPFFERHKLKSKKRIDFEKFRRVIQLMSTGGHLTQSGIEEIRKLSATMNRKGKWVPQALDDAHC